MVRRTGLGREAEKDIDCTLSETFSESIQRGSASAADADADSKDEQD